MRALTASLRLVVPPVSNQEADRIKKNNGPAADALRSRLRAATIYMIVQRQEIFFDAASEDEETGEIRLTLTLGGKQLFVHLDVPMIGQLFGDPAKPSTMLGLSKKYVSVFDVDEQENKTLIWGANPDSILFDAWRGEAHLRADGCLREFATYRLLYIGMSDDGAYQRLINAPHHARLDILTNELQVRPEARVTDEIYFLMFEIDPLHIQSWAPSDEITDEDIDRMISGNAGVAMERLTCDVEKAFISMLDTPYNTRKYKNYPNVKNGLSELGLDSYAYTIAENISLDVMGQRVDGGFAPGLPSSNEADFIIVRGEHVSLVDISEETKVEFGDE